MAEHIGKDRLKMELKYEDRHIGEWKISQLKTRKGIMLHVSNPDYGDGLLVRMSKVKGIDVMYDQFDVVLEGNIYVNFFADDFHVMVHE